MTHLKQYKALFPLKGEITQEIINTANTFDYGNCIGALTLKAALGVDIELVDSVISIWGSRNGIQRIEGIPVAVTTIGGINMMRVTEPQSVTFILTD